MIQGLGNYSNFGTLSTSESLKVYGGDNNE